MFDRGGVNIAVAAYFVDHYFLMLTEEWFILLWLIMLLTDYCLRFDREVVCIVVAGHIVDHYCWRFDREVVCIVVAGCSVAHYYLMFYRRVVHIVVAGYVVDRLLFEV